MLHCLRIEVLISARQGRVPGRAAAFLVEAVIKPRCLERAILDMCVLSGDLSMSTCRKVNAVLLYLGCYPSMQFGHWLSAACDGRCHPLGIQILKAPFESCWQQRYLPTHKSCQCQKIQEPFSLGLIQPEDVHHVLRTCSGRLVGHFCTLQIGPCAYKAAGVRAQSDFYLKSLF